MFAQGLTSGKIAAKFSSFFPSFFYYRSSHQAGFENVALTVVSGRQIVGPTLLQSLVMTINLLIWSGGKESEELIHSV